MRSLWVAFGAFAAVGLVIACCARLAQATPESDFEARREQERKDYEIRVGNMPMIEVDRIGDLLDMKIDGRQIVVHTSLKSTVAEGYMRMKSGKTPRAGLIRVQGGVKAPGAAPVVPEQLTFTFADYTRPLEIATLAVNSQQTYCNVSKASRFPGNRYRNILLVQKNSGSSGESTVELAVNEGGNDSVPPVIVGFQAPDFFTLVHSHSAECDQYLRPLMRELGQESIFAPDPLVARQVFPELCEPSPADTRAVRGLLPLLDQDDFRARLRASRELDRLGRDGAAVLIQLDRAKLTPEQNARIDLALAHYTLLRPNDAVRFRSDPTFLLDCLYSDDAALRKIALNRLRKVSDAAFQFEIDAPAPARAAEIQLLRKKLVPEHKP